jgi:hypothetical protein
MIGTPVKIGSFEVIVYQDRTGDYMGELFQKDYSPYVLQPNDKVRFKVGRGQDIPLILDLLDGSYTVNKSFVQVVSRGTLGPPAMPASYFVQFGQGDIAGITPGAYDAEVSVVRAVDGLCDLAEPGVVHIIGTMGGNLGLT